MSTRSLALLLGLAWFSAALCSARMARADLQFGPIVHLGSGVNTSADEVGPCLSADGLELHFAAGGDLYRSTRSSLAEPFGPASPVAELNTEATEGGPHLSSDGLSLYFRSDRTGVDPKRQNLWMAARPDAGSPFGAPICLPVVNGAWNDLDPVLSPDALSLYFSSDRNAQTGHDIWTAVRASPTGDFGTPTYEGLVTALNTESNEGGPALSADGLTLLLHSNRLGGRGGDELYVATRASTSDPFGAPVNLGPAINTPGNERDAFLTADGRWLLFSSDRPGGQGGLDLYAAPIRVDLTWAGPDDQWADWAEANWLDEQLQPVAPHGGEQMLVARGYVEVSRHQTGWNGPASVVLNGINTTLRVGEGAALDVLGALAVGDGAAAEIAGQLASNGVTVEPGGVLAGTGTISAPRVVIGGRLSPGALALGATPPAGELAVPSGDSLGRQVPEPSTAVLVVLGGWWWIFARRGRAAGFASRDGYGSIK